MKELDIYKSIINDTDPVKVFEYLSSTLNDTIKYWDYFVNWNRVLGNVSEYEIELNTLNYLVGKTNIEEEFTKLIEQQPPIIRLVPLLLACRENDIKVITDIEYGNLEYERFTFHITDKPSKEYINKICRFAKETGVLELFKTKRLKSVPDYVLGIEVGLDSNARKNRGGTSMEKVIDNLLIPICKKHNLLLMKQASSPKILNQWNINLEVDKTSRRFDFAINKNGKLFLIETNYYSGGGSKLKSTAGEYQSLNEYINKQGHNFIWITDGQGWKSTLRPLQETFNKIDYTLNIKMVLDGVLEYILTER